MDFSFYDNILDAIFVLDCDKKIVYSNEASSILVGISQKRMQKGRAFKDVITLDNEYAFLTNDQVLSKDLIVESLNAYKEINFKTQNSVGLIERKGLLLVQTYQTEGSGCYLSVIIREMTLEENLHTKYKGELEKKELVIEQLQQAQVELKNYSLNLEKMVEQRTMELKSSNSFLNAMINSLEQGLLVFDKEGTCLPIYTKACERLFHTTPYNRKFWEVIDVPSERVAEIEFWSKGLFKGMIPFVDFVKLGPSNFTNINGRFVELEYFPMKDEVGKLNGIVTVATDKTEELNAKNSAIKEHKYAQMIIKITKSKEQFFQFISDCKKMVTWLNALFDQAEVKIWDVDHIFRQVHSIKGMASMFSILKLETAGHKLENHLSQIRGEGEKTLLDNLAKLKTELDSFKQALGLVIEECKIFLGDSIETGELSIEVRKKDLHEFSQKLFNTAPDISTIKKSFDETFINMPIIQYFYHYSSMLKELAVAQDKKINEIEFNNPSLRIDPEGYKDFFSSLIHLFRNSIYHGIETPEVRQAMGKNEFGRIVVSFSQEQQKEKKALRIVIDDDGQGIDVAKIREKLKEKLPEVTVDGKSDQEIMYHIFDMGISTAKSVDVLAGRGVGMSAVLSEIKKIGGEITLSSKQNLGTTFDIVLPYKG